MKTFLTLETGATQLNAGFEQSKNILADSSDVLTIKPNTLSELEKLQAVLGWLTVGNYPLARSGLDSLINKPAFGWACGSYVAWTGDDYILSELADPIKFWKNELTKDRSPPSVYEKMGFRALAGAYHGRRDTSSAQDFERCLTAKDKQYSHNRFERQQIDRFLAIPPLPDTPEHLAMILGLTWQEDINLTADQVYLVWQRLNTLYSDSNANEPGKFSNQLILASLITSCFLLGIVGTLPDASSGRVTLEPSIPDNLNYFDLRNLRMGLDAVDLLYVEEGGQRTFVIEQTKGRVPLNLILKPNLSGTEIDRIYINGNKAKLEWWADPKIGRVFTQVQLYLDQKQTVTVVPA
ncbi:MAG TPA: hypothetical protein EYQ69_07885 [Gemmatimonadetes bacterium]|jgi:hypothetical protein|nr:hypothetical protein [Gemmatimonadota bacterium]